MREDSFSGGKISYPDNIAFAYNPNHIVLSGVNASFVTVSFSGTKNISVEASLLNGSADIFISKFLQLVMGDNRSLGVSVNINSNGSNYSFTLLCINGSINIGVRFGNIGSYTYDGSIGAYTRRVRWFKRFPFRVSLFAESNDTVLTYRYDSYGYSDEKGLSEGFNDIDPSELVGSATNTAVLKVTPFVNQSTFDDTFDYTFHGLVQSITYVRLVVDESVEGHYFRWVDHAGQMQYFLFSRGTENTKVTESETTEDEIEIDGMYFGRINRPVEKTTTRDLRCCAVNLTDDEQDYVKTIVSSVKCDMYIGQRNGKEFWMPVNVKAGSFSVSEKENLQDYEISVELPTSQTQTR